MSTENSIESILDKFEPVFLEEMGAAGLMRRKDSKFIFNVDALPALLEQIREDYRVLEVAGKRSQYYETTYYDTEDLEMYHLHHRGKATRHKVRFRNYTSSGETFLEVKRKNARRITSKKRMSVINGARIDGNASTFLEHYIPYGPGELKPSLDNHFKRITLVSKKENERITLDLELGFSSRISGREDELPGVAIAELKYTGHLAGSALYRALREARILPRRISKYCTGMALLHPDLKQNLFKTKLYYIQQIISNVI